MQHVKRRRKREHIFVSILTRSGDRVQPLLFGQDAVSMKFQSSPGPETGCNADGREPAGDRHGVSILTRSGDRVQPLLFGQDVVSMKFQSSPGPETRCNWVDQIDTSTTMGFQSSPGPETGCNLMWRAQSSWTRSFNPHPVRRPGATPCNRAPHSGVRWVSILTRSGDRVQHDRLCSFGAP